MYITLATRRDQVDFINEKKLAELPGEEYVSVGIIIDKNNLRLFLDG